MGAPSGPAKFKEQLGRLLVTHESGNQRSHEGEQC